MLSSQTIFQKPEFTIVEKPLPQLHKKIFTSHLRDNNKLLSDEEIKTALAWFDKNPDKNRYGKLQGKIRGNRTVIKFHDLIEPDKKPEYFAIYHGAKSDRQLGMGAYGKVKLMQNLITGEWAVIKVEKILPQESDELNIIKYLIPNEIAALRKMDELIGHIVRQDNHDQLIGMALHKGIDLFYYFDSRKTLPSLRKMKIALNICHAVAKLHNAGLIHGDIKIENIIIDPITLEVKLADFQFSGPTPDHKTSDAFGTPGYMAPEIFSSHVLNIKTDIYALGKTLALTLGVAFQTDENVTLSSAADNMYAFADASIRSELFELVKKMCAQNPEDRISITDTISVFNTIETKFSKGVASKRKIGILNFDEYSSLQEDEKELTFQLQQLDEVWVVDNTQRNNMAYYKLCKNLESAKIKVGTRLFHPTNPDMSIVDIVSQIPAFMGSNSQNKNEYFYVTAKPLTDELKTSLQSKGIRIPTTRPETPKISIQPDNSWIRPFNHWGSD